MRVIRNIGKAIFIMFCGTILYIFLVIIGGLPFWAGWTSCLILGLILGSFVSMNKRKFKLFMGILMATSPITIIMIISIITKGWQILIGWAIAFVVLAIVAYGAKLISDNMD